MNNPILYFAPNACSLATHIALREAGLPFDAVRVDLSNRRTEHGEDFATIHTQGYVPALKMGNGQLLTESVALLDWISQQSKPLCPTDEWSRTRQLALLSFLSTQLHKPFVNLFFEEDSERRGTLFDELKGRFSHLEAALLSHEHVLGPTYGVGDSHLYVMERWATMVNLPLAPALQAHAARVESRPAVIAALAKEGIQRVMVT